MASVSSVCCFKHQVISATASVLIMKSSVCCFTLDRAQPCDVPHEGPADAALQHPEQPVAAVVAVDQPPSHLHVHDGTAADVQSSGRPAEPDCSGTRLSSPAVGPLLAACARGWQAQALAQALAQARTTARARFHCCCVATMGAPTRNAPSTMPSPCPSGAAASASRHLPGRFPSSLS
eukprot:COSAG01_NODE_3157_length_6489_cov_11.663380_5_plen_178_part_00